MPELSKYLTNTAELTLIADEIRAKGETSSQLVFPNGFISAINDINTGTDTSDTTAAALDVKNDKYFYTSEGVKTQGGMPNGSALISATTITTNPSIVVDNSGLIAVTVSANQDITPLVSFGYVSSATAGTVTVNGINTHQLVTQAAQTITPGTTDKTIASGKYLTGTQTIKGDANLKPSNIAKDISIFGIAGTLNDLDKFIENHDTITNYTTDADYVGVRGFGYCYSLETVTLPSASIIGAQAFIGCSNLTTVNAPLCDTILSSAFYNCSNLTTLNISNNCSSISYSTFYGCAKLTTVSFPNCTIISNSAFGRCTALTTGGFSKCVTIGDYALYSCKALLSLSFPKCTTIGNSAFMWSPSITTAYFPICTTIGNRAFYGCSSLTSANFPSCITVGDNCFEGCKNLQTVNLPKCTNLGSSVFYNCSSIHTVSLNSITNLPDYTFYGCKSLFSLYLLGSSRVNFTGDAFTMTPMTVSTYYGVYGTIYVPKSLLKQYQSYWYGERCVGV